MLNSKTVPLPERMLLTAGRLLAFLPTPQAMSLLATLAAVLPKSAKITWTGAAHRRVWRMRGEALWAARQSREALCRRLSYEGWEHLHRAAERGRGVILVGRRPAGWDFALLALARYGRPVALATSDVEDDLLGEEHRRLGNTVVSKVLRQEVGSVCAAFEGIEGAAAGQGAASGTTELEIALGQGASLVPLFAARAGKGWRLSMGAGVVFEEKTTSKKGQALEWAHRTYMQAAETEARRLPDDWSWQTKS